MKIIVISLICALAGGVAGSFPAWNAPLSYSGALLKTVIPPQVKGFAYSTSQYINAVPSTSYTFGLQPQIAYQVPSFSGITPIQSTYYPIASPSVYPSNLFFPTAPGVAAAPESPSVAPEAPAQSNPGFGDTTIIDSADNGQYQEASSPTAAPAQSTNPAAPASTFPNFPAIPQIPQLSGKPQETKPMFPQFPQFSQEDSNNNFSEGPGSVPPSFLGVAGGDKGINDEDTISVESA